MLDMTEERELGESFNNIIRSKEGRGKREDKQ
jgi:hypothetical protein